MKRKTMKLEISYSRQGLVDGVHEHWFGYNKDSNLHPDKRSFKAADRETILNWIDQQLDTLLRD